MLALDGGGIRGILTLGILQKIEKLVADRPDRRLCDYFDYIAGTSTGAIIAAGLSRGMTTADLFSLHLGRRANVANRPICCSACGPSTADPLKAKLQDVFGSDTTFEPAELPLKSSEMLLLVSDKNFTTDSPWPVSTNPDAKYNAPDREDCNLKIPLWQLVRASTAAPVYFPPEVLAWDPNDPSRASCSSMVALLRTTTLVPALPHGYRVGISFELDRGEGICCWFRSEQEPLSPLALRQPPLG